MYFKGLSLSLRKILIIYYAVSKKMDILSIIQKITFDNSCT
jgi:hypothetical protein